MGIELNEEGMLGAYNSLKPELQTLIDQAAELFIAPDPEISKLTSSKDTVINNMKNGLAINMVQDPALAAKIQSAIELGNALQVHQASFTAAQKAAINALDEERTAFKEGDQLAIATAQDTALGTMKTNNETLAKVEDLESALANLKSEIFPSGKEQTLAENVAPLEIPTENIQASAKDRTR